MLAVAVLLSAGCGQAAGVPSDAGSAPRLELGRDSDALVRRDGAMDALLDAPADTSDGGSGTPRGDFVVRDRLVDVATAVPGFEGETFRLWTREVVRADLDAAGHVFTEAEVVLTVHGATVGGDGLFDAAGGSVLEAFAARGFSAWTFDLTGYGRSTKPGPMDDPCTLAAAEQRAYGFDCAPRYGFVLTSSDSERADLGAVVDFVRRTRGVARVGLLSESLGGSRVVHFASTHPEDVGRVVFFGTGGSGVLSSEGPTGAVPREGASVSGTTEAELRRALAGPDCREGAVEPAVVDAAVAQMLTPETVGLAWGPGVLRAPTVDLWGAARGNLERMRAPALVVGGECDPLAFPATVDALYRALGAAEKVRVRLEGAGHVVMLETGLPAFVDVASEWLREGSLEGRTEGDVRVDPAGGRRWR